MAMRSVLITGTSKGIGYETALAFARAGYRVHATMRHPSDSPALSEMAAQQKLPISVTALDVDTDESVNAGIAAIQAQHGAVDVLVNNAGIECFGSIRTRGGLPRLLRLRRSKAGLRRLHYETTPVCLLRLHSR